MTKLKNDRQKGITLIALVVTIVVLIILATVSILAVFGDNGIIARAQTAKDTHEKGNADETNTLDDYASYIGNYLDGKGGNSGGSTGGDDTPKDPTDNWDLDKVTIVDGGNDTKVPVPNGFYYVGGDVDTGFVISDKQGDTLDASGVNMGNQFVWIPVASEADLTRTNFDANGKPTTNAPTEGRDVASCTEPFAYGYSTEASEYATMKTQVLKYGGFYLGRFEAGVNSTTLRKAATSAETVVCKKGVAPYNYISWGNNMSSIGTSGAVYLAKNMYANSDSVTSTLTYGCQWDAMCRYIGDNQRTTPATYLPALTGNVATDVSKKIYDLAGNCLELTMEAYTSSRRVRRGGAFGGTASIGNSRAEANPSGNSDQYCFRPTLYIK